MRRSQPFFPKFLPAALALLLASPLLANSGEYKLEKISTAPEGVNDALKAGLQAEGARVLDGAGNVWCEVWIRKEIAPGSSGSLDALYSQLHIGSMLGILRFPDTGSDFRGQAIKPNTFTMRYALLPQDGAHMGMAPIVDFLVLIPTADDTLDADAEVPYLDLMKMSRKASGTNHPAILNFGVPPEKFSGMSLAKDDAGHWVLHAKAGLKGGGELPLSMVVVGKGGE
ncbi:MAG: hypothetical protein AB1898_20880 [Acidobacteriota bacterium]